MRNLRSPLAIIFLTVFIDLVGFGIVIPILPLYAERFGASPLVIGLLLGVYSAMQCLCAPLLGKLSDRIGRRPVLLMSLLGTAAGFLLMGLAQTLSLLFVARIIDGATGGNISTAQAYIADVTSPEERSKGMGLIGAAFGLGFIFGPAIGGVLSHVSIAAPFIFASGLAAMNAAAVYCFLPESLPTTDRTTMRQPGTVPSIFRMPQSRSLPLVMATYFVTTVAFSLLTATYPLFTERRFGYGPSQNGYIFACQGLLSAIIQGGLVGWLVKISSDKTLALAGALLLAVGMFWLPLSGTAVVLFTATAIIAVGHGLVAAPLNGLASKQVSASAQGRVLGLMQSTASTARIVGPVLGGWLMNHDVIRLAPIVGQTPYWAGGACMLIGIALASRL
ncbi:MAG: MFS transporter [Candidatus Omnitrophica bacterium]|nr:MFS transporter [Candidatus Omnitrophota bacterium]